MLHNPEICNSIKYAKTLIVDPTNAEVAGVNYKTIANAVTYAKTQTPSSNNIWGIKVYGVNNETINLEAWIHIIGEKDNTILGGPVSCQYVASKTANVYAVVNCQINDLDLYDGGPGAPGIFLHNCLVTGGTMIDSSSCYFFNGGISGGKTFCYYVRITGGTFGVYTTVEFSYCYFTGGILNGGIYYTCTINDTTFGWAGAVYAMNGCTLLDSISMTASDGAVVYLFNTYHSGIDINAGNALGTYFVCSLGGSITENGGTWVRGDGDFGTVNATAVHSYTDTLTFSQSGSLGFNIGSTGLLSGLTSGYEALVLTDDAIPNKRYTDYRRIVETAINLVLDDSHEMVKVTASATITLPTAVGRLGKPYTIDNAYTADITLLPEGAELIEGETSQAIPPDSAMQIYSDNTGWRIR